MYTLEYCGAFRGWRTSFESGQGSTAFREDLVLKTAAHQTVGKPKIDWGDAPSRIGWPCKVMPVAGSWHFRRIRKTKPTSGGQVQCFVWKSFASGLREDWNTFRGISGSIATWIFNVFRPRPGQKIIDTMGSDENRDTAKLQAAPIRNEGENLQRKVINFSGNGTYQSHYLHLHEWSGHRCILQSTTAC